MAIKEALELVDKVSSPAARMARAVGSVEKAMEGYNKAVGAGDQKKAERAFGKVAVAAKRYRKEMDSINRTTKRAVGPAKKLGGKDALGALGLGGAIGSGIVTAGVGLLALINFVKSAASAAVDLAVAFGKGLIEAHELRSAGKSLFDTLSGGKGDEVMERLKTQSIATGQSMADLQATTKKARDSGVGFADAFKLNLLRGDLIASGRSASEADGEIGKLIGKLKAGGNASKEIAKVAKQFNVAGNGANAATKQATTLSGVLTRLKAAPGNIMDALAQDLGPDLDAAAAKVTKLMNEFVKSGQAKAIVDGIAGAVKAIGKGISAAAPVAKAFWDGLKSGIGPIMPQLKTLGDTFSKAFGGDKKGTMDGIASAAKAVGTGLGLIVKSGIAVATGLAAVIGVGARVIAALGSLGSKAASTARDLIDGLKNGIKNGIQSVVDAAKELADKVSGAVKSALKIGSPSKLFESYGGFTAEGFTKGVTGGIGDAQSAMGQLTGAGAQPANGNAVASSRGGGGGGGGITVNITVTAAPGASKADGERMGEGLALAIRRELQSYLEVRALEAAS
jgi:hypothetical protein